MNDFRFKIGDMVLVRVAVEKAALASKIGMPEMPNPFMISQRILIEDAYGTVRDYIVCGADGKGYPYGEEELMLLADFDCSELSRLIDDALDRATERADRKNTARNR